jgi:hypothetical protein
MSILARLAALGPRFEPELGPMRTPTTVQEETQYIRQFVEDRQPVEDTERFNPDAINYDLGDGIDLKEEEVLLPEEQEKYETGRQTYTRNGRNYLLIIYSDGTSDEQDLGPADQPQAPPEPPATTVVPGEPVEEFDARAFAQTNYPWLGDDLIDTFLQEFNTNGGDEDEALRVLRTTQAYKDKFPGIFREDGTTLRIEGETPELSYIKIKEDYTNLLADYNLNPDYFEGQITTLFENDVAPRVFEQRLNVAYNSLFGQFDAVKEYYVANYPNIFPTTEDISDEAIFASFISEDVSADIINRRIQVSQIGGAFREQDFTISTEQAQRLISAGVSGQGAQQLAARAEVQLPRLQRLAQRFTGREDIFGLSEFIESEVFGSGVADQVRARLEAEQQTAFTREGGAAVTQAGVTGLVEA